MDAMWPLTSGKLSCKPAFTTRRPAVVSKLACSTLGRARPDRSKQIRGLQSTLLGFVLQRAKSGGSMPTRALTESAQLPLESKAPYFELPEPLTGNTVSLNEFKDASALLVIFMCNHCPFVKLLKGGLVKLAKDYQSKGVKLVGISSNSVDVKPMDGPAEMAADAKEQGYPFPYLFDEDQAVAQSYQAMCTPEFFLFDKDLRLQYHGQFDSARPSNGQPVTGEDVRKAIDNLLSGKEPEAKVKPSIGCNIKWHPGREPAYA